MARYLAQITSRIKAEIVPSHQIPGHKKKLRSEGRSFSYSKIVLRKAWQFNVELLCNLAHLRNLRSKSSSAASQCYSRSDDVSVVELVELGCLAGVLLNAPETLLRVRSVQFLTNLGRQGEARGQTGVLFLLIVRALREGRGCG